MSDLSDVQSSLVDFVTAAVYPNGSANPSIANVDVRIYQGWPIAGNLDADLSKNKANISIFSTGTERNTTRFGIDWQTSYINSATITLTVLNDTVTVTGTPTVNQTCMVIVDNVGFAYAVQANDTLLTIAAKLAAMVTGASINANVIIFNNPYRLSANVSTTGQAIQELKRQEHVFIITIWAPSDAIRSILASNVDASLASKIRFTLPDNVSARLKYHGTRVVDEAQKAQLYRRDLTYSVEYATTISETDQTITNSFVNLNPQE